MKGLIIKRLGPRYSELVRGASSAFTAKILGAGLGFAFNVVIARTLGTEGTGLYFLALAAVTVLSVVGRLGLDNTLLREVAARVPRGNWSEISETYRTGIRLALSCSIVCFVILFVSAPAIAEHFFNEPELDGPMRAMSVAIVPLSILILHGECLKALKKVLQSQLVQGTFVQLISLAAFLAAGKLYGLYGAVSSYLAAVTITSIVSVFLWRRHNRGRGQRTSRVSASSLLRMSAPLLSVGVLNIVAGWTASFVLGALSTASEVGIYNVAFRTAWLTSFILVAVNAIAAPKFAALYHENRAEELREAVTSAARLTLIVALPVFAAMLSLPALIMSVFGSGFAVSGAIVLQILAVSQLVNVVTGSVTYLLMMSGFEKFVLRCVIVSTPIMAALTILLVPAFGAVGAAIAALVGMTIQNLLAVFYAWDRLGIWSMPFGAQLVSRLSTSSAAG